MSEAASAPKVEQSDISDEPASAFVTAATGRVIADTAKKFVRTAQLKFKTNDVLKTTLAIEDIAIANGGFVTKNHFSKTNEYQHIVPISADSSLETLRFTPVNQLQLRVPYWKLDTTIRAIGRFALYLNYRIVTAADVELDLLENQINNLRSEQFATEMKDIGTGKTAIEAKTIAQQSQAAADVARMENLRIADKIKYSTIDLDIYQNPGTLQTVIANEKPVNAFKPGFLPSLGSAFVKGWGWMKELVLALATLWPIWLLMGLGYWVYKKLLKSV